MVPRALLRGVARAVSKSSVPSWSHPVKGKLLFCEVLGPFAPNSFFIVGFVVPSFVVEVLVFVGDLVAVQPVNGHALGGGCVGSAGIVAGIVLGRAADDLKAIAVRPYVGMAGGGAALDPGVVGTDAG